MIVNVSDFNFSVMKAYKPLPAPKGNRGGRRGVKYMDVVCAFDIETTRLADIEQSIMYIWQFQIGNDYTVIGRTWPEYLSFIQGLLSQIPSDRSIVVYVHNLSYEFTFLKGIYKFDSGEVFAVDSRKVLKCTMYNKRIEYRCSYLQTNMSLAEFTKKMKVQHQKLPDYNYTGIRYPWTELTPAELDYCVNDVVGLVEAIQAEMLRDNDNLYSIPITSTGYVRRDVKAAMKTISHFYISDIQPDYELYQLLHEAFRGGNTHANRYYATADGEPQIVENVKSADRSSSYPDVICNCDFPIRPFVKAKNTSADFVIDTLIKKHKKPVIMRCSLADVKLKNPYFGAPYLAKAKCKTVLKGVYDNGRILRADYIETTITDIDLKILQMEYDFILTPYIVYYSSYGKLPQALRDVVIKYYKGKTELKNVAGQEVYYMKYKNLLNSIYGMMATNPVKISILFDDNAEEQFQLSTEKTEEDLLQENKRRAFVAYQWGVWVTAWARYMLELGIHMAGDGFVYADTDSVKYVGDIDWSGYNTARINASRASGAYATDPQGITHYMGVFEPESGYDKFCTMGAKKYAGEHDGKIEITIAGVNKKLGAVELKRAGGLNAFRCGFIFHDAGGLEAVYNDRPQIRQIVIDGHKLPITSNVVLRPSTYTLGVTDEYWHLIRLSRTKLDILAADMLK